MSSEVSVNSPGESEIVSTLLLTNFHVHRQSIPQLYTSLIQLATHGPNHLPN